MKMHFEIEAKVPARTAWEVLGEGFGTIYEWTSSLKASSLEGDLQSGAIRTCESCKAFGPFKAGIVREKLVEYDPKAMVFEYEAISGLPGFVQRASNRWSIHEINAQNCLIQSNATLEIKGYLKWIGPLLGWFMKADLRRFQTELHYRIVNGKPHPDACRI